MNDWTPESIASARRWNSRGTGSMAEKTRQYGLALDEIERLRGALEESLEDLCADGLVLHVGLKAIRLKIRAALNPES